MQRLKNFISIEMNNDRRIIERINSEISYTKCVAASTHIILVNSEK